MAAKTRTIEEYVVEIVHNLEELDMESLDDNLNTLQKMKTSSRGKHQLNYWRMQQCLGETALDVILKHLHALPKSSCKEHMYTNMFIIMRLFLDSLCSIAAIKRVLSFKKKVSPLLFKAVRQVDNDILTQAGFSVMHRLVIVGKQEMSEFLLKYGILKDVYKFIKGRYDCDAFMANGCIGVTHCSSLLLGLAKLGSDNIRKQIRFSSALRYFADYVGKLKRCGVTSSFAATLCEDFSQLSQIVSDDKYAQSVQDSLRVKEQLKEDLCTGMLYLFCSSPICRKMYEEKSMEKFQHCGACRLSRYCSKDCQRSHWMNGHKTACLGEAIPAALF